MSEGNGHHDELVLDASEVILSQLDRIEQKIDGLSRRVDAWEAVLPEPGSLAGRALARRAKKAGVNLWDDPA